MEKNEIRLLMLIYKYDKTPPYIYDGKAGVGQRFKTPREHIRDFLGSKVFWENFREFEKEFQKVH